MKDKIKLKILEYWIDNPTKLMQIPTELKDEVKKEDIGFLLSEIECGGTLTPADLVNHAEKIRNKIK